MYNLIQIFCIFLDSLQCGWCESSGTCNHGDVEGPYTDICPGNPDGRRLSLLHGYLGQEIIRFVIGTLTQNYTSKRLAWPWFVLVFNLS